MDAIDETKTKNSQESGTWLDRMHPFLQWKVIVPDCNNPFATPMSNNVLIEFATKKDVLLRHVELKGNVDGEEIITLRNITREIDVITNHPAVISMKRSDIKYYIQNSGVLKQIDGHLLETQARYLEELKKRKVKLPSPK